MVAIARALLIVNPASRRGDRLAAEAHEAFRRTGVRVDTHRTTGPGDAAAVASAMPAGYDALFTLGGDGTVREVVDSLRHQPVPLGILPGGTGNLLARSLGIPLSVSRAVSALRAGVVREIDLGRLEGGGVFAFAAGIGIDATMVERTSERAKRRYGMSAYAFTAVRAALAVDAFELHVTVDGARHACRATAALVANFGRVLGGVVHLGPTIREDDGMLDLCVFSPVSAGDALRLGWRMVRRNFGSDQGMHFIRGRAIRLETDPPRPAQADGEMLGAGALAVEVLPRAVRLLVPGRAR